MSDNMRIYALIATREHDTDIIDPGYSVLIRAKDKHEQEQLMREVALAVAGDVVKLSNGIYMILSAFR